MYLYIPEDAKEIEDIPEYITPIYGPVKDVCVVSSGAMDFFDSASALSNVRYSALKSEDWEDEEVQRLMNLGEIEYCGKYSAPDYELLKREGTGLILENTMINHSPGVLKQLRSLGFPVITEYSSLEENVLGRMEWIKLIGLMTGHDKEALEAFETQEELIKSLSFEDKEARKVAFFYITSTGGVSIKKGNDYIVNMIETAGGEYAFKDIAQAGTGSSVIQVESFYEAARDADLFIYNSSIGGMPASAEELRLRCPLLEKCRAFNGGKIYSTSSDMYKSVMRSGEIIKEINEMISGNEGSLKYFYRLK